MLTVPPPDLLGRGKPDRFLRGLTLFSDAYGDLTERVSFSRLASPAHAARPVKQAWRPLVVAERTEECADVVSLRLAAPPGSQPLPRWQPGAHLRIELPSGLIRHYSLCGDPADGDGYTIAVRRLGYGTRSHDPVPARAPSGSAEIHDTIEAGTVLRIFGPRNGFPFAAEPVLLFIAGGIGITPLLPMIRQAAELGRDWRLVYCCRSRATMPFAAWLAAIDPARVELRTDDEHGRPDPAELLNRAAPGTAVYCCGPPPLLDAVRAAADRTPRVGSFRFERFTAAPIRDGHPFTVELRRSRRTLAVPADRSVLDVLREHDPATPYSCRQGFCGTCRQHVLAGRVEHRDRHLTDEERSAGDMLVCVSRAPAGETLVLDL